MDENTGCCRQQQQSETDSTTVVDRLVRMDDESINSNKGCHSSRRKNQFLTANTDEIAAAARSAARSRNKLNNSQVRQCS